MQYLFGFLLLLAPSLAFAVIPSFPKNPTGETTFADFVDKVLEFNQLLVLIIFALTLLVFIWGITKAWIFNGGDEKEIANGKQIALAGIIGLVVMSGIWGILAILQAGLFDI